MLHLLRQLLFTAKGMGTFRKDGFERSARSFDARRATRRPRSGGVACRRGGG